MIQLPIFKRDITKVLAKRLTGEPNLIQVITGPRQVGKTTAVKQVLEELKRPSLFCSADLPAPPEISWIEKSWQEARVKIAENSGLILVLDEVQKIGRWSEVVKKLWDEDRRDGLELRVVILGSSSLLIQRGLTESLAGRFELNRCFHWNRAECRDCFGWNLDQFLYFGGYPGAARMIHDEERWAAYVRDSLIETSISKDVLLLNPVEKPALLRQLFMLAAEYGGQILSYQKMVGQLQDAGNTTTLAHYQHLLESAYLIAGLQKFSGSRIRIRQSSPKWLPLNNALMAGIFRKSFSETRRRPDLWGRFVECAVGAHLFEQAAARGLELFYWREGDREVDFVLRKGSDIFAIEVKSGRSRSSESGLEAFKKKYKSAKTIHVGGEGIPVEDFLLADIRELL